MTKKGAMIDLINNAKAQARNDKFKRFVNKNSKIISALFLILAVVAIFFVGQYFFNKYQQKQFAEILHQTLVDQQLGEVEKAKDGLQKIHQSAIAPSDVKAIASFRLAAILLEEKNQNDAIAIYQDINNCFSCDDYFKDLAGLLIVKIWMNDASEIAKDDIVARIEKIESNCTQLKPYISEQKAWALMQKKQLEKSYETFSQVVKDAKDYPNVLARCADGMKIVVSKGFKPKEEAAKTEEKQAK